MLKLPFYLPVLTSIRGLAAVYVVIFHFLDVYNLPFIDKGYMAVDFFFLLSGFVMCHVYKNRFEQGIELKEFFKFMWARFARVYPLHFVILMALVVMEGLRYVAFKGQSNIHPAFSYYHSIPALIANILMLNCFLPYESWNAPVWSVCAEWFMYLLFPGLTFGLGCIRNASGLLILLALLFFGFCLVPDAYSNSQAYWIRCAFEFPMGCLIYFLIMRLYTQPAVLQTWIPILPWLYALALGLMLTSLMVGWREPWIVLTEFLVLLMMVLCHQCRLNRWLAWKPLHYLGEISYSIYLVHLPLHLSIINFSTKILHQNILALSPLQLSLLLSINSLLILICASLTYHFIEKPARDWLKVSGSMVYQSGKRYFANLAR